jgi:hypothetical protein
MCHRRRPRETGRGFHLDSLRGRRPLKTAAPSTPPQHWAAARWPPAARLVAVRRQGRRPAGAPYGRHSRREPPLPRSRDTSRGPRSTCRSPLGVGGRRPRPDPAAVCRCAVHGRHGARPVDPPRSKGARPRPWPLRSGTGAGTPAGRKRLKPNAKPRPRQPLLP